MSDEYIAQLQARVDHFERLERRQARRADEAVKLLARLQKNPNVLSGRRRVRVFLRRHWDFLREEISNEGPK